MSLQLGGAVFGGGSNSASTYYVDDAQSDRYYSDDNNTAEAYSVSGGYYQLALASNRNMMPVATTQTTNNVRHSRVMFTVPSNTSYANPVLCFAGFGQNSASEFEAQEKPKLKASIELLDGTIIPVTFDNGKSTKGIAKSGMFISDPCTGYTLAPGTVGFFITKLTGQSGNITRMIGQGTHVNFGEGAVNGVDDTLDLTDGNYGKNATIGSYTNNGTSITSVSMSGGNGGSGYTAGVSVYAWQKKANGVIIGKTIGNASRTGAVITSVAITDGTPPAGESWNFTATGEFALNIVIGNRFSATTQVYAPCAMFGTVNVQVDDELLDGDSITIGFTSADSIGDENRNFGIYERGIANRVGVANISTSGQYAQTRASTSIYRKTYNFWTGKTRRAMVLTGSNDVQGGASKASVQGYINAQATRYRNAGTLVDVGLLLPRGIQNTITGISKAANAVITVANSNVAGDIVYINTAVGGMTQIRDVFATVVSATPTTITINVDSTGYSTYTSGGVMTTIAPATSFVPDVGFTAGSVADLHNADVISGVMVSDRRYVDGRTLVQDLDVPTAWDDTEIITKDTIHPGDGALGRANLNAVFKSQFANLG